jgi:nicotinamide-nucleotide amidase
MLDAVTYSNSAKTTILRVDPDDIRAHGEVSRQTAEVMAINVRKLADTHIGISITGIAGPTGGTENKPIGLVFIGFASEAGVVVLEKKFSGDRVRIQTLSTYTALAHLLQLAQTLSP